MRQLLVVLAVLAGLGLAVRFTPPQERILPLDFSKDFPEHREHHEQLLHNLGQRPLRSYPGDAVRMWWVGPNPQQLLVVEPTGITEVTYQTDGYKPRVVKQTSKRLDITPERWTEIEECVFGPEMWEMTPDPGLGPFTVGGRTWILEMKQGERYRCMEKIDRVPSAFGKVIEALGAKWGPQAGLKPDCRFCPSDQLTPTNVP